MKNNNSQLYPISNNEKSMVLKAMDQLVKSAKEGQSRNYWDIRNKAEAVRAAKIVGNPKAKKLFPST